MTTEEKAKAYDEALKRAKQNIDAGFLAEDDLSYIFPELREGEDERIRKEIISALKFANYDGVYDKHIAWLEKQKDSVSNAKYIQDVAHAFEDGRKKGQEEKPKPLQDLSNTRRNSNERRTF